MVRDDCRQITLFVMLNVFCQLSKKKKKKQPPVLLKEKKKKKKKNQPPVLLTDNIKWTEYQPKSSEKYTSLFYIYFKF